MSEAVTACCVVGCRLYSQLEAGPLPPRATDLLETSLHGRMLACQDLRARRARLAPGQASLYEVQTI